MPRTNSNYIPQERDTSAKLAIALAVDGSGSMRRVEEGSFTRTGRHEIIDGQKYEIVTGGKSRLDFCQEGLINLANSIASNPLTKRTADVNLLMFNETVQEIVPFGPVSALKGIRELPSGTEKTLLGEAVNKELDLLMSRCNYYRQIGRECHSPWLIIMSDGEPYGSQTLESAIARTQRYLKERRLHVIPVAIGKEADRKTLGRFSGNGSVLDISVVNLGAFFEALSDSISISLNRGMNDELEINNLIERLMSNKRNGNGRL